MSEKNICYSCAGDTVYLPIGHSPGHAFPEDLHGLVERLGLGYVSHSTALFRGRALINGDERHLNKPIPA